MINLANNLMNFIILSYNTSAQTVDVLLFNLKEIIKMCTPHNSMLKVHTFSYWHSIHYNCQLKKLDNSTCIFLFILYFLIHNWTGSAILK